MTTRERALLSEATRDLYPLGGVPLNLSTKRAAEFAGVSRRTIDRAITRGLLVSIKLGGRRLVPREALRGYLMNALEAA